MLCIHNTNTEPAFNLAVEEYLLRDRGENFFMLWRSRPSIIVGKHQNANAEINRDFVREHKIIVLRRLSGGGTVFHDLGNINFTFIQNAAPGTGIDFRRYTEPILEVLHSLGVDARFEGRNDLRINGLKFSGNAQYIYRDRVLHHGTLLFSSKITDLSAALKVNPLQYTDKAIKSVRSRVTNISEHLQKPMKSTEFIELVMEHILSRYDSARRYQLTEGDISLVERYQREKYETWEWNFGSSPQYSYRNSGRTKRGDVEFQINVEKGCILDIRIVGDFLTPEAISMLEKGLIGVPHEHDTILHALRQIPPDIYSPGVSAEELVSFLV